MVKFKKFNYIFFTPSVNATIANGLWAKSVQIVTLLSFLKQEDQQPLALAGLTEAFVPETPANA